MSLVLAILCKGGIVALSDLRGIRDDGSFDDNTCKFFPLWGTDQHQVFMVGSDIGQMGFIVSSLQAGLATKRVPVGDMVACAYLLRDEARTYFEGKTPKERKASACVFVLMGYDYLDQPYVKFLRWDHHNFDPCDTNFLPMAWGAGELARYYLRNLYTYDMGAEAAKRLAMIAAKAHCGSESSVSTDRFAMMVFRPYSPMEYVEHAEQGRLDRWAQLALVRRFDSLRDDIANGT